MFLTLGRSSRLKSGKPLAKVSKRKPIRLDRRVNGVETMPDGREVCDLTMAAGKAEYKRRIEEMALRQQSLCALCGGPMIRATFEHALGRGLGGGHRDDRVSFSDGTWRNAAAHQTCNDAKGSQRYEWRNNTDYVPIGEA